MRLRAILTMALGDLRLAWKERSALFWMVVMPVAFIGLFGSMFRSQQGPVKIGLAVVDEDRSFASRSFVEMLKQGDLVLDERQPGELDSLRGRVRLLTLPAGFEDSLATKQRVALRLESVHRRIQDNDFAAKVQVYKAVLRMLATLAEADSTGDMNRADFESKPFQARFAALGARPELVRTEVRTAGKGHAVPTGFGGSAPAMLVLFLLMNTVIYGSVLLTQEKQSQCLSRLASMPVSHADIVMGKILGRLLIGLGQSLILLVAGRIIFRVDWGPSPGSLLLVIVSLGLCASALGILLGSVLKTVEQASAVSWIIPLLLGAIGGCWWPLEIVPSWMRAVGHISPAAWAMDALHGLMAFGKGPSAIVVPCAVLLCGAAILTAIGARFLRTE